MIYALGFLGLLSELLSYFLLVLLLLALWLSILLHGSLGAFLLYLLTDWGISYGPLRQPLTLVFHLDYSAGPTFPEVAEGWQAFQKLLSVVCESLYHFLDSF